MAAEDPRARLRRYLEQRRELGETELVLDSLDVNDVMRLLGAGGASDETAGPSLRIDEQAGPSLRSGRQEGRPERSEGPAVPGRPERSEGPAFPAPASDPSHGAFGDDWRAALRAAGAGPEGLPARQKAGGPEAPPTSDPSQRTVASPATPPAGEAAGDAAVSRSGEQPIPEPIASATSLVEIAKMTAACTRCPLYETALNAVPGEGNPDADFMIVGEAPGATEDETGRPFVGQAGQLLTKIIEAINLRREDVFIANVLKHRPPGNRNPKPDEVVACSPYLRRQIELVRPKVLLALGTFAAQTLLDTKLPIGKLRGQVHQYHGVPLIVTYHPAALLRNPAWKRPTWEDVQLARRVLDRAAGA